MGSVNRLHKKEIAALIDVASSHMIRLDDERRDIEDQIAAHPDDTWYTDEHAQKEESWNVLDSAVRKLNARLRG